jgi:hypothetical protein
VTTGVLLGDAANGSAGAYLRYGNQTPTNSGSTIAVTAGGTTIDTGNLTSTTPFQQGRYEFTGVIFTGQASFEGANPNFIFVGTNAAGSANGSNPSNRISTATFLASDNTSAFLAGKTVIFVNDNVAGIDLGATTLNLGSGTTLAGFGNGASITVPGGVQPVNVIGDNFVASGGTFTDGAGGAATVHSNAGVTTLTLNTGNTLSNFILGNGGTSISGTTFGTLTVTGMVVNNTTGGALNLNTGTLAGTGFNSITSTGGTNAINLTTIAGTAALGSGALSGASGTTFNVNGGTATITYNGTIGQTNAASAVSVTNKTAGTTTFGGAITASTSTADAVTVSSNTGATTLFTGGLALTTTSGNGFVAATGGTVGVSGAGNTITTTTGTGLNLNGVAVATTGITLQSVSSNGATSGIILNNLTGGGVVGVQVTGTGATAGSGGTIQNTTGPAVSLTTLGLLGGGVTLNNMTISGGGGVVGTTFGTLSVTNMSLAAVGNAALSLTTGAITAGSTFSVLSSSGSATNGVLLSGVTGSFSATTGTITNAAGASWAVVGGTVSSTYSGSITQANNAALLSVTGGHATGTITFNTGTLSATNGTGLQFDNADGAYNFNGTTTLNGGDAGVDILNGSSGTFSFNANTSITNPTGTGFTANGSTANVTYSGNITKSGTSAGLLVDITNESAGTITFQTGTLSSTSTNGTGINLNNADGTVNFNGTTTLNGGNAHVDINTGSAGTFSFGTGTTITSPTGTAFVFNGSTASVTYSGSITQANNALMVDITNQATGAITFQTGTLSASNGTGINLNNADGGVSFNGTTTLNGGNAHIDINTGSGGIINFTSGASVGATTAPTGVAFREDTSTATVTYNGTLRQTNAANAVSINAKTGGTTAFNGAITASTSTANAITLTANTGGTITFTGGLSLTTTSGVGFNATGGGTVSATQNNASIVNTVTSTTGTALNIANTTIGASGVTFHSISSNGAANGISLVSVTGGTTGLVVTGDGSGHANGSGGSIQNATSEAVHMLTNSGVFTFSSMNFAMNTSAVDGILVDNNASGTITVNIIGDTFTGVTSSVSQNKALLQFESGNAANVTANVQDSFFNGSRTYGFAAIAAGTSIMNVTVNQSGFGTDVNTGAAANRPGTTIMNAPVIGLLVSNSASAQVDYVVSNNTFWGASGSLGAIYAVGASGGATTSASHLNGSWLNNQIGKSGVVGSGASGTAGGIGLLPGTAGTFNVTVQGNDIRQVNSDGLDLINTTGGGANITVTAKIKGNTFTEPDTTGSPTFQRAIAVTPGNSGGANNPWTVEIGDTTGTIAAAKNTISGSWQVGNFIRVSDLNNSAVLTLPGLTPTSGATAAQVNTYLTNANTLPASSVNSTIGGGIVGGAPLPHAIHADHARQRGHLDFGGERPDGAANRPVAVRDLRHLQLAHGVCRRSPPGQNPP